MSDPNRANTPAPPPPPAPPLPPQRYSNRAASALVRFAQPFLYGSRPASAQASRGDDPQARARRSSLRSSRQASPWSKACRMTIELMSRRSPASSRTTILKTDVPISAVDISPQRTHAVIAGKEVLKTIQVAGEQCAEGFDIRAAIIVYASTHNTASGGVSAKHKDQLAATDVKWSHGDFDTTIATAASNGRIVIYDLHRAGVELARLHEHNRQVHRLAFNPFRGSYLLSGSQDATIKWWDLRMMTGDRGVMTCQSRLGYQGNNEAIRDLRWSPTDGAEFAVGTDNGVIQRWDVRKANVPLIKINAHEKACHSVDWHPDGKHLVSGSADKQVKVWDFSSSDRPKKPCFQFRAPQAVSNARWRPPCWSSESRESGQWQCTQLVTSYTPIDPRIHLWDFRRPHIPFREFDRYDSPPTCLLWHSKDLLWTVGNDGIFTQTDIQFAPQVVQRRSMCSVAWSPNGDVLGFVQQRPQRRGSGIEDASAEFLSGSKDRGSSGEKVNTSRSLTDDGLDGGLLSSSFRKRNSKASSTKSAKSLGGTPPSGEDVPPILTLEKALENSGTFESCQAGVFGEAAGATTDPLAFRYLAEKYAAPAINLDRRGGQEDVLKELGDAFRNNAKRAEHAGLYRLSQDWKILGYAVDEVLLSRAEAAGRRRLEERIAREIGPRHEIHGVEQQDTQEERTEKLKNPFFKGVIEVEGYGAGAGVDADSTSNMTTPLAKPLPDSRVSTHDSATLHSPRFDDKLGEIAPLPPALYSSESTVTEPHHGEDEDLDIHTTLAPTSPKLPPEQRATAVQLEPAFQPQEHEDPQALARDETEKNAQKSAPRAIEGRANWRDASIPAYSSVGVRGLETSTDAKRAALSNYRAAPKTILTFDDVPDVQAQPHLCGNPLERHDSTESFQQMFSASTDSSLRAKSMEGSFSPIPLLGLKKVSSSSSKLSGTEEPTPELWMQENDDAVKELPPRSPIRTPAFGNDGSIDARTGEDDRNDLNRSNTKLSSDSSIGISNPKELDVVFVGTSVPPVESSELERPEPSLPFLQESMINDLVLSVTNASDHGDTITVEDVLDPGHEPSSAPSDGTHVEDMRGKEADKPWLAQNLIKKLIEFHARFVGDVQLPAHLILLTQKFFNACNQLLDFEFCEAIFLSYNAVLLRLGSEIEAAELRKLCVPLYPQVYAYAQADTYINVYCYTCERPYENSHRDDHRCDRCKTVQANCPVCLSKDPPSEWAILPGDTRMKGNGLWNWCQGCGHGGHVICITKWLDDITGEGECATPGCGHDCGPGPVRRRRIENMQQNTATPKRWHAKRDSLVAPESRAVERVRTQLGQGPPNAAGSGGGMSSGAGIGKKVRVVTPREEVENQW